MGTSCYIAAVSGSGGRNRTGDLRIMIPPRGFEIAGEFGAALHPRCMYVRPTNSARTMTTARARQGTLMSIEGRPMPPAGVALR